MKRGEHEACHDAAMADSYKRAGAAPSPNSAANAGSRSAGPGHHTQRHSLSRTPLPGADTGALSDEVTVAKDASGPRL